MVSLSLYSGPIAQNEIRKMLEALSGTSDAQVQELDEEDKDSEEIWGDTMKKLGLIGGMGPESTIPYYHDIVYGVQKKTGKDFFPPLTIIMYP